MSYGEIIKTARKRLAMTQGDLSDKVGCTRTTICDWERESYPPTDGKNIARLEAALELPPGALYKTIFVDPTAPRERPGDRMTANAALIAAAPEMLTATEAKAIYEAAVAAVKKARGL